MFEVVNDGGAVIESKAFTLLREFQDHQDGGSPWGYALDRAIAAAEAVA